MAKLWRRPQGEGADKQGAAEVDLERLRIDRPSLIFLNGFFITDKSAKGIPSSLKAMEEIMNNRAEKGAPPVDVYSWTHAGLKDLFNVAAYTTMPGSYASAAVRKLAAGLIMPLVAKDFAVDASGVASGTPLPLDEAKKNLRNITLFGYSAGGITAQECFNASLQMMKQVGYDEKDARDALHEVVLVGAGAVSRPAHEKDRFTTLFLEATNDRILRMKQRVWEPLRALFNHFAHALKIKPMGEHAAMISAAVPKKHWEIRIRDGKTVREKVRGLLPASLTIIKTYHELPRYMTQDEELSPFAKMVQYALANAVARQQRLSPLELLETPPGVAEETAKAYRAKIAAAYVKPVKLAAPA